MHEVFKRNIRVSPELLPVIMQSIFRLRCFVPVFLFESQWGSGCEQGLFSLSYLRKLLHFRLVSNISESLTWPFQFFDTLT